MLEGPAPWHLVAHGEVEVLLVCISLSIDESFGDAPAPITTVPDVTAELLAALADPSAWTLHPPDADTDGVVLSPEANAAVAKGTVLHPAGRLQIRQRLVPFGLDIDRFGGQPVPRQSWRADGVRLRPGAPPTPFSESVEDQFALGMFRTMTNEEQVSSTSFSAQQCGGIVTPTGLAIGDPRNTDLDWDTVVVGPDPAQSSRASHLAGLIGGNLLAHIPATGRAIDTTWAIGDAVTVLAEVPTAVVPDVPVIGVVPTALAADVAVSATATDLARKLSAPGARAVVVEQWELA
jgi:hypothetical protein